MTAGTRVSAAPRRVIATRYVAALREGGSLPGLVEADDDGMYVVKFRQAGQGPRVLIAELVCGLLGQALGLPIPELVLIDVAADLGRNEPESEIRDLVTRSAGLNLGVDHLPGALAFDSIDVPRVTPWLASAIVWFDAYILNVDRTARNTNLLWWHRTLQVIDQGAALYVHFTWDDPVGRSRSRFSPIRQHVLLARADDIEAVDRQFAAHINAPLLDTILAHVPDDWLNDRDPRAPADIRRAYREFLLARLAARHVFVEEISHARAHDV
jgi:hypothetical protein